MKDISVFEVIGPNMIGPSSSHTAGALRIARVAYQMKPKNLKKVTFILYGSFAKTYKGHGTDRALVAGMLGMNEEDENIKDSYKFADKKGLIYKFIPTDDKDYKHPNTVQIKMEDDKGNLNSITGSSIGGGSINIDKVNGIKVSFSGEYCTLIITHNDKPGITAYTTNCLGKLNINIAYMRVYRREKGQIAYTIIEADDFIENNVVDKIIKNNSEILYAQIIKL